MPFQLAAVRIQGEERAGVEVVSRTNVSVVIRPGIPRAPVEQVQLGIVRAGQPGRGSAVLPRVASPRLRPGFARRRHGPEAPDPIARPWVVRIEKSANATLSASDADNHLVLDCQRRASRGVVQRWIRERLPPHDAASARIERDELRIQGREEQRAAEDRQPAIDLAATRVDAAGQLVLVGPQRPSRFRIERDHVARRAGHVHDAIHHNRRRLDLLTMHLVDPLRPQPVDVVDCDLIQAAVVMASIIAAVGQPVARFLGGVQEPFIRHWQTGGRGGLRERDSAERECRGRAQVDECRMAH